MSTEYPSLKMPLLALTLCAVPFLWFFDWAIWALIVVGFFLAAAISNWWSEVMMVHRAKLAGEALPDSEAYQLDEAEAEADDEDFLPDAKTLWQGKRQIRFAYSDHCGGSSDREVTVHRVVSSGPGNNGTYFQGHCHLRDEPRTFRLDRIKGRKVTDTSTGEVATFRQLFGLRSR